MSETKSKRDQPKRKPAKRLFSFKRFMAEPLTAEHKQMLSQGDPRFSHNFNSLLDAPLGDGTARDAIRLG